MELKLGLIYLLLCRIWFISEGRVVSVPRGPESLEGFHNAQEVKELDHVILSVDALRHAQKDATLMNAVPEQPKNMVEQEELRNVETVDIPARAGTQFRVHRIHHNPHHSQQTKVDIVNRVSNHESRPPIETIPPDTYQGEGESEADDLEDWPHFRDRLVADLVPRDSDLRDSESAQWSDLSRPHALPVQHDADEFDETLSGPVDKPSLAEEGTVHSDHKDVAHLSNNRHYEAMKGNNKPMEKKSAQIAEMANVYFIGVVAACSVAGLLGVVMAGVCWYKLQKNVKAASEVEYPAYGIQGQAAEKVASPGDRKLAQSAQIYHYQYQKQQMLALEKEKGDDKEAGSDLDSEDENEEGHYTVYECPGLAPTGEMEVKNPLFGDDTPLTPNTVARSEDK